MTEQTQTSLQSSSLTKEKLAKYVAYLEILSDGWLDSWADTYEEGLGSIEGLQSIELILHCLTHLKILESFASSATVSGAMPSGTTKEYASGCGECGCVSVTEDLSPDSRSIGYAKE
jgi:hypothetical protein